VRRTVVLTLALALAASPLSAQVILRRPGDPQPGLPRSQGPVPLPSGVTDPDGPYTLAIRVYMWPTAAAHAPARGRGVLLLVTDPAGRRFGHDSSGSTLVDEIPHATYDAVINPNPNAPVGPRGRAGVGITLPVAAEGSYELQVTGLERAQFDYVLLAFDRMGRQRWMHFGNHGTEPGAIDVFQITYSLSTDPPVWITEKVDRAYLWVHAWGDTGRGQDVVTQLLLTDPRGRRLGQSPDGKARYAEIPRSSYGEGGQTVETMELEVMAPLPGAHTLEVIGTRAGRYDLEIRYGDSQGSEGGAVVQGIPTAAGIVHRYRLLCGRGAPNALTLSGAYAPGRLLSFASPTGATTRVSLPQGEFTIVVFYGSTLLPESFAATLNGADMRTRFHPKLNGHEAVRLQLRPGRNELVLSASGVGSTGEPLPVRTGLEFHVR
jgi:hypothetical protein